jgi:hypothetical protein
VAFDPLPADNQKDRRNQDRVDEGFKSLPEWARNGRIVDAGSWDPDTVRKVEHGLNRRPAEWMLVSLQGQGNGYLNEACVHEINRDAAGITFRYAGGSPCRFKILVW